MQGRTGRSLCTNDPQAPDQLMHSPLQIGCPSPALDLLGPEFPGPYCPEREDTHTRRNTLLSVDMIELVQLIGSIVSSTVTVGLAVHRWWQNKRDRRIQHEAYQQSRPTSEAAKELEKLMGVQANFWSTNPQMWAALGGDAAGR